MEATEGPVVRGHVLFPLEDMDLGPGFGRPEAVENVSDLARRDGRVALDDLRKDATEGLDPERQRRDVEQEDILDVAGEDAALDGRPDGDDLVRIDAPWGGPLRPKRRLDESG